MRLGVPELGNIVHFSNLFVQGIGPSGPPVMIALFSGPVGSIPPHIGHVGPVGPHYIIQLDPWYTMVYNGIPWYTTVYHGIPWYAMVYHGIPWYTMVYHNIVGTELVLRQGWLGGRDPGGLVWSVLSYYTLHPINE